MAEPRPGGEGRASAWTVLASTSIAHFVNDGTVFFIPVMADILASHGQMAAGVVTAMLTTFYLSSSGFGLVVGQLADRGGRRGAKMATGIAGLAVGLVLFAGAIEFFHGPSRDAVAVLAALVAGLGSAFYHPLGASLVAGAFPARARARALGANGALGSLGRALYPTLFFAVTGLVGSHAAAVLVFAVVAAGGAALLWQIRVDPLAPPAGTRTPDRERAWLDRNIAILTGVSLLRSLAFTGMVAWLPVYFTSQRGLGLSSELGLIVTLLYAGGVIGQPLFGLLADKLDKRLILAASTLGAATATFGYLHSGGALGLALLGLFGLFNFSGFPLLMSLVADYVPEGRSTTANAFVWGLGSTGGQAVGPLLIGLLALNSYRNLAGSFELLAGVAVVGLLGLLIMRPPARSSRPSLFG